MESTQKQCQTCAKAQGELLRCTRCKGVYYCGVECQKKDWPQHKLKCAKAPEVKEQKPTEPKQESLEGINEFGKLEHIGTGNFSTIFKGTSKKDGKTYAIKQAEKAKLQRMRKEADLFMEKHCLSKLKDCEYVVRLWKTFQDQLHLFLQMECPANGQLWDHSKFYGIVGESIFKYFATHIVKAINTLHDQYDIVHRDLKPQNILLNDKFEIKLIDFGTAKDLSRPDIQGSGNGLKGRKPFEHYVGTPNYMAPECIHNKASDKISDVYSLSGVFYHLKTGNAPFAGGSEYIIFTKSLENEMLLCPELFSPLLRDLMLKMNKKEMSERLTLHQIMEHEYFQGVDWEHLPTYEQALNQLTPMEKYLRVKTKELISTYESKFKETTEVKQQIYKQEIISHIDRIVTDGQLEWKEELLARTDILKIQTQLMINLKEDANIGFTELYKEARNIVDPVVVEQLSKQEETTQLSQSVNSMKFDEVCTHE